MDFRRLFAILACSAVLAACGRSPSADQSSTDDGPTVTHGPAPVIAKPLADDTTQPSKSALMIGDRAVTFGPAMLRLSKTDDGKIVARLYSDQPQSSLNAEQTVNSYDLRMILPDATDPAHIDGSVWSSSSGSIEKQNSPYGIFLTNNQVLQPMDVSIAFTGEAPTIRVSIQGTFCLFTTDNQTPSTAGTITQVVGVLNATVPSSPTK
ncbi:MAG: hypothetical protein ABSG31_02590 [Tepidisphaeraceae bacterium]|jgi:hypothetical protein